MSVDGKVKYLTENLNQQIEGFSRSRQTNKKKAFWLKMLAVSFSSATTILLGLQGLEVVAFVNAPVVVKNLALILSAFVTLFSTFDAFFNHRALWVRYTRTTSQLKSIKAELEYLSSDGVQNLNDEDIDRLFKKYQLTLEETNAFWHGLRDENALRKETE